jgi:hypothetical protein
MAEPVELGLVPAIRDRAGRQVADLAADQGVVLGDRPRQVRDQAPGRDAIDVEENQRVGPGRPAPGIARGGER